MSDVREAVTGNEQLLQLQEVSGLAGSDTPAHQASCAEVQQQLRDAQVEEGPHVPPEEAQEAEDATIMGDDVADKVMAAVVAALTAQGSRHAGPLDLLLRALLQQQQPRGKTEATEMTKVISA